jgi:hypothetical protein
MSIKESIRPQFSFRVCLYPGDGVPFLKDAVTFPKRVKKIKSKQNIRQPLTPVSVPRRSILVSPLPPLPTTPGVEFE